MNFPYRLDRRWSALFLALGVNKKDGVSIYDNGDLVATFGRFKVKTTRDNVSRTLVTGPHRWYTAVGLRLSLTDDSITFGTNHKKGLSIEFVQKVPRVIGFRKHSTLWATDPYVIAMDKVGMSKHQDTVSATFVL